MSELCQAGIVLALPEKADLGSANRHGAHSIARKRAQLLSTQRTRACYMTQRHSFANPTSSNQGFGCNLLSCAISN
jgi:hypothetical protein